MNTLTYTGELTVTACWCGINIAIPRSLYWEAQNSGKSIYCPLGHTFVYNTNTEVDRLKQSLANERDRTSFWREEADRSKKAAAAAKGQTTKIKNRIKKGVCPFCNRHFTNVQQHMETQHAEEHDHASHSA